MSIFKGSIKWLYSNAGKGPGSWSENFYFDGTESVFRSKLSQYASARRGISSSAVSLISIQTTDLSLPGVSNINQLGNQQVNFVPGTETLDADVPQMALAFKLRCANGAKRTFLVKGVPDDVSKRGRYAPTPRFLLQQQYYSNALANLGFSLRTVDKTMTPQDVVSISSTGLVTMAAAQTWGIGGKLQLYRCTDANKQGVVGNFPIVSTTDAYHYQLGQWGTRNAVVRGKIRLLLFAYPQITIVGGPDITVGKIGSPSKPYVGRRKKGR